MRRFDHRLLAGVASLLAAVAPAPAPAHAADPPPPPPPSTGPTSRPFAEFAVTAEEAGLHPPEWGRGRPRRQLTLRFRGLDPAAMPLRVDYFEVGLLGVSEAKIYAETHARAGRRAGLFLVCGSRVGPMAGNGRMGWAQSAGASRSSVIHLDGDMVVRVEYPLWMTDDVRLLLSDGAEIRCASEPFSFEGVATAGRVSLVLHAGEPR